MIFSCPAASPSINPGTDDAGLEYVIKNAYRGSAVSPPASTVTLRDRVLGAMFVLAALAVQSLWMGRAAALLGAALVVAYLFWSANRWQKDPTAVLPIYLIAVAVQCLHLGEEYLTGFQRRFPILVGYEWSDARFVTFNLIWLAVFVLAALGAYRHVPLAYLVILFFALGAGVANGAGHLLLMTTQGGYFPGGITAPLCLLLGILLLRRLFGEQRESSPLL
jgi:uncharacterized protein with HXXEE motif